MTASWGPEPKSRTELPGCGAARRLQFPEEEEEKVRPIDEWCSEDWADNTCGGGAEEGPTDADTADPLAAAGSFSRLLLRLAAEHRRALAQLRAELEDKVASSAESAETAQKEKEAEPGSLAEHRLGSKRSMDSRCSSPGLPAVERWSSGPSRSESPRGGGRSSRRTMSMTPNRPSVAARRRRKSVVRRTASTRLSPFDFVSEDERGGRRRSSEAVGEVLTEMPQALGSEMSSTGSIRLETRQTAKRASMGDIVPRCVQSQTFDTLSGALILLNSVMLGWAADISVENSLRGNPPDDMPKTFKVMTISFTSWFTMELLLRACAVGPRKFFSNEDRMWNIFDSMTVGTDIVHTLLEITSDGSAAMQNLTVVRMLRIMRITRAIRMVRLIRFFRELRMMVFSVLRSGSSLLWSLLMLIITIYIFGIYFVQVVAYHLYVTEVPPEDTPEYAVYATGKLMFGSLLRSVYTLYQAVSGGISWGEIGSVLIGIAPVHGFVLCFFTFFTTFALLNIITGIFVDSSINSAQNDKDEVIQEQLHQQNSALSEMQKLFQLADKDGSGSMDLDEFEEHLQSKEVRAHFLSLGIEVDKVKGLFRLLDLDMSGELSLEEFVQGCTRLRGPAKSIDLATLMNEYMRMSDDLQRFFSWSDGQFNRLYHFQVRLEKRLDGLFTDEV